MIFVTVGTEFPFDRLVRAMDAYAAAHPGEAVVAQIGTGSFEPAHMRWFRRSSREEFAATVAAAELIVAHAGVGSVVTAGEHGKPIVLLARHARLGEQRNDHQIDTASRLGNRPGVRVAASEADLGACIAALRATAPDRLEAVPPTAPAAFLDRLRTFIGA